MKKEIPAELLEETIEFLGSLSSDFIVFSAHRFQSDYQCRFCGARTKTNGDFDTEHYEGCELEKITSLHDRLLQSQEV
jgi:hypothetical protein